MKLVFMIKILILVNTCFFQLRTLEYKTASIKALFHRATKGFSNQRSLDDQTKKILSFMPCNGFPNHVSKPLLCYLKSNSAILSSNTALKRIVFLRSLKSK